MARSKGRSSSKKKKSKASGSKKKRSQNPQPEPEVRLLFQTEQPPKTFHRFPSLPPEIKNMIYKLSTQFPRIYQIGQIRSFDAYLRLRAWQGVQEMVPNQYGGRGLDYHPQVYGYLNRCPVKYPGPGVLHVSREWRSWVMKDIDKKIAEEAAIRLAPWVYPNIDRRRLINGEKRAFEHRLTQAISFNFGRDQLFFVSLKAAQDFTVRNTRGVTELQRVKTIAVHGIDVQNCDQLIRVIQIFGELDRVYLVHPEHAIGISYLARVLTGLIRMYRSTISGRRRNVIFKEPLVICQSEVDFLGHEFKR